MGAFDFLKVIVNDKPKKSLPEKAKLTNFVSFDGKSFPITQLTHRGFAVSRFDGSLIKGQKAHITLTVNDQIARFSLTNAVLVVDVTDDRMVAEFNLLTPDMENLLKRYAERRKKAGPA